MTKFKIQNSNEGFIALISAIIISLVILTVTVVLNFSAFFGRFNILDSEFKEASVGLAEACVDAVMLELGKGTTPADGTQITIGAEHCTIVSITPSTNPPVLGAQKTVKIQAVFKNSYTNLEVAVTPFASSVAVNSWKECRLGTGTCN